MPVTACVESLGPELEILVEGDERQAPVLGGHGDAVHGVTEMQHLPARVGQALDDDPQHEVA